MRFASNMRCNRYDTRGMVGMSGINKSPGVVNDTPNKKINTDNEVRALSLEPEKATNFCTPSHRFSSYRSTELRMYQLSDQDYRMYLSFLQGTCVAEGKIAKDLDGRSKNFRNSSSSSALGCFTQSFNGATIRTLPYLEYTSSRAPFHLAWIGCSAYQLSFIP